jgi:hypothetical protein
MMCHFALIEFSPEPSFFFIFSSTLLWFFLAEFLSLDESQFKFGGISVRFIFVEEKRSIGQEERKVETSSFFRIDFLFRTCRLEIEPENQTTFSGLRKKIPKFQNSSVFRLTPFSTVCFAFLYDLYRI